MFTPGAVWNDTSGQPIQAHGGGILYENGLYYWYGENKDAPTISSEVVGHQLEQPIGFSCYTSANLYDWTHAGVVLTAAHVYQTEEIPVMERPKVLRCPATGQYVMWFHADHSDYSYARCGIATSDSPLGPFTFRGTIQPAGGDSRDFTVYQDDDGAAYVLFSSEWNKTLHIARLRDDYLGTAGEASRHFIDQSREAPAVFKRGDRYYMVSSGCTGWDPNPAEYATAPAVTGPWTTHGNPCVGEDAATTFHAQSTFVLPLPTGGYIFMADRWKPRDLRDSRYVWLPCEFEGDRLLLRWHDQWDLSVFGGQS